MTAGANSIFTGNKLLTTGNRGDDADAALFAKLGLRAMGVDAISPRHPGLEPGSRCVEAAGRSGTPAQGRGDEDVTDCDELAQVARTPRCLLPESTK